MKDSNACDAGPRARRRLGHNSRCRFGINGLANTRLPPSRCRRSANRGSLLLPEPSPIRPQSQRRIRDVVDALAGDVVPSVGESGGIVTLQRLAEVGVPVADAFDL